MAEERRVVTILFADVAGSTALGENLDPEDARALLRRYYDIARETIVEHGGILEKFIGDAVVAVFGFPQTHDDDPRRALAAALLLRDRVRGDPSLGERLPIRIGVNTGEVVATPDSAVGDFPLTGDAVNVAARLQTAAEPWGIVCGERTAAGARGAFEFGAAQPVDARGRSQRVQALSLLGRASRSPVARRASLVGRDADLQQLQLVGRRALEEKRPFLVSIIAPAGVGKTRLLEEFLDRLPEIEPRAKVAIAQCLPYGQRLTYWPLRGVLYRLIGLSDDAMAHEVRAAIRSWLEGSGMEALDREVELLAATVGAGETEVSDRSALLAAWRTFFEIAARRAPLVLVFEDLHWSSDSLLDLFEFVMQPRGELPLLMIALTRPELLDRRSAWGGGRRNYISISLEPLTDADTARLVKELLADRSDEVVDTVVRHAEGNPFFVGELVRAVIERPGGHRLPDTVQATVLARLDLLPPHERRTIQLGSVFGRAFRLAGVQALEPQLSQLDNAVEQLLDKDLLRAGGADLYTFRHILIREVAYQTLTRSERARLHGAAAAWMEGSATGREDALAELIAYHYRESATIAMAQRPDDVTTEQVRQKAVEWLSRAADVAAAAAATSEASRHVRSAIELAEETRLPDLYQRLGDIRESADFALPAYRTALRLCREQRRPPEQELQVMAGLLSIYTRLQGSVADRLSLEEMQAFRDEARQVAARVDDEGTLASYLAADAFYPFWLVPIFTEVPADEVRRAKASADEALAIARRLENANVQSMALDALASISQIQGDWVGSREFSRQRLRLQARLSMEERVDALSMVAWASAVLGDLQDADRSSSEGLSRIQPGQVPAWTLHLVSWRTYVLTLLGRWDDGLQMAERARQLWMESGKPAAGYAIRGFMSAIDLAVARQDEELAETYRVILETICMAFPERSNFRRYLVYARDDESLGALMTSITQLSGPGSAERSERILNRLLDQGVLQAVEVMDRLLAIAQHAGFRPFEAQLRRAVGLARREPEELDRAIKIFEDMGARPYAARVHCEHAILVGDQTELENGLRALESIGDRAQLCRYERMEVR